MSDRSGLVLDVRVDKNGVPVRRWVRAGRTAPGSAIPAPAVSAPVSDAARLAAVEERLMADGVPVRWNGKTEWQLGEKERFRFFLATFRPDTIREIEGMLDRETRRDAAHGIVGMTLGSAYQRVDEDRVRAYAAFAAPIDDEGDFPTMEATVRGLHQYSPDVLPPMDDYTQADDRTRAVCRALVLVAERLHTGSAQGAYDAVWTVKPPLDDEWDDEDGGSYAERDDGEAAMPVVGDPELAALIAAHPEKAQQVVDVIESTGFVGAAAVEAVITGAVPAALAGGAL